MELPLSPQPQSLAPSRELWRWWPEAAILLVALLLRVVLLGMKPPHFDEGVNGFFVDWMTRQGFYHYDPTNFHGPLHFYVLFFSQTLFGRNLWALRLPIALFSLACVGVALAYRRFLGATTCRVAALAIALSPAMTFYGRYAIHESFLLLSLMVTVWGLLGLYRSGERRDLWATALGLTGMILTKETYAIHVIALLLAYPALWVLERFSPSAPEPRAPRQLWGESDLKRVLSVCAGLIILFYTGCFMDWGGLTEEFPDSTGLFGLITTFLAWTRTGLAKEGGQVKEWHYWFDLLRQYEWATLVGLAGCVWLGWPGRSRLLRYVALAGLASLSAYTIIRYKTPWCIIVLIWPFLLVFGALVEQALARWKVWVPAVVVAVVLGHSAFIGTRLNFWRYADEAQPYVYVQTLTTVEKIMGPLRAKVQADPAHYQLRGRILTEGEGDNHPLPWLLGDFPHVAYLHAKSPPPLSDEEMTSDFLLIEDAYVADVEERLQEPYFRESFTLRGSSGQELYLYWRAARFADLFPGREPEYHPTGQSAPAPSEDLVFPVEEEEPAARELRSTEPASAP